MYYFKNFEYLIYISVWTGSQIERDNELTPVFSIGTYVRIRSYLFSYFVTENESLRWRHISSRQRGHVCMDVGHHAPGHQCLVLAELVAGVYYTHEVICCCWCMDLDASSDELMRTRGDSELKVVPHLWSDARWMSCRGSLPWRWSWISWTMCSSQKAA